MKSTPEVNSAPAGKPPEFQTTTVIASVVDLRFDTQGNGMLRVNIPFFDRANAVKFIDAYGLELIITATKRSYDD